MQIQLKKLMTVLILPLMSFNCSSKVSRPDTEICVINALSHEMRCFNLRKDYDASGTRRTDSQPVIREILGLEDVHKMTCTNPDGLAELKRYISELREKAECQP